MNPMIASLTREEMFIACAVIVIGTLVALLVLVIFLSYIDEDSP